jgi:hypothetical protein
MKRSASSRVLIATILVLAAVVVVHLFATDLVGWLKALHGRGGVGRH